MAEKSRKSWIIYVMAVLCSAAGLTLYNFWVQVSAGETAEAILTELVAEMSAPGEEKQPAIAVDATGYQPVRTHSVVNIDGLDYVGIITIPAIDIQLPVINEWSYPNLKVSPCRMQGSGYTDDLVILAHNYTTHF